MREDILNNWLAKNKQHLSNHQLSQLTKFQQLVLTAPMNLTAIKNDEDFTIKHFIDSLTLLPWLDGTHHATECIDIGTGAGFPGIPLKIARPNTPITLLDSLQKRILFLRSAIEHLGLNNVECVHARAEDFAKQHNGRYYLAMSRAVAKLGTLAGYALPLVKPGGLFLAMKGPDAAQEIEEAKPALDKLSAVIENVEIVDISPEIKHSIIVIRRIA